MPAQTHTFPEAFDAAVPKSPSQFFNAVSRPTSQAVSESRNVTVRCATSPFSHRTAGETLIDALDALCSPAASFAGGPERRDPGFADPFHSDWPHW